ncbi:putative btb poz-like protein [Neofusicoccum parvum UCRNP2]|uniref:Putative btb poz-like protein n=1 Tax=Botryosphaeria parva (strain UCR-NP2) TaxID=1287680 RepID=R1GDA6_BOTPV|nr:putative btb poz-like protein [Neofusicoccum parvum UCRNP2]
MAPGTLSHHLYNRGLLDGRHSDIAIIAFGKSRSEEVTLHPEGIDSCITEAAFELTLKRLYGCDISEEEDVECLGLFATACWLEMQDLIDSSIDAILRRMHPDNLGPLIKLVTMQYYGRAGERLLASGKAMLCRDGCEMKIRNWDEIPGEIVREIVGGDGFYIHGEWERWVLAKRLLDRRLKKIAFELGLTKSGKSRHTKAPDTLGLMAVRFDSVYRQNAITTGLTRQEQPLDEQQRWIALYTHHEIEPLLVLLEEGIHYIHLDFEQLQFIRTARDIFGLPIVSEKTITNALWMQMELRQKVLSVNPQEMELGLSKPKGITYTHFPPFRFAAEFPNPRLLKEKKRVYSRTVFYAGSLWNIYIQKVRSAKNPQLGVYLHRAKEYSAEDGANTSEVMTASASTRIGELERRILGGPGTERSQRRSRQAEQVATAMMGIGPEEENTSGSGGDGDGMLSTGPSRTGERPRRQQQQSSADLISSSAAMPEWMRTPWATGFDDSEDSDAEGMTHSQYVRHRLPIHTRTPSAVPLLSSKHGHDKPDSVTIPPYIDGRPTIKTYFKIYSPSKGGRLLSVYESAPDRFNFSQSWGWKSSTLMLDDTVATTPQPPPAVSSLSGAGPGGVTDGQDVLQGVDGPESATVALDAASGGSGGDAAAMARGSAWKERGRSKKGDGLLRFMVVIGNL